MRLKLFSIFLLLSLTLLGCGEKDVIASSEIQETIPNSSESPETKTTEDLFAKWVETYPNPLGGETFTQFSTNDLNGNPIDQSFFQNKKLTLVNLWASYCGPCIEEIPHLQELSQLYEDDFQVLGILSDGNNENSLLAGKKILEESNVTYPNMIIEENTSEQLFSHFNYVPVSLFVDENGVILEYYMPGGGDFETFQLLVDHMLEK